MSGLSWFLMMLVPKQDITRAYQSRTHSPAQSEHPDGMTQDDDENKKFIGAN